MKKVAVLVVIGVVIAGGIWWWLQDDERADAIASIKACKKLVKGGFLEIADDRSRRFLGKVEADTARCRGGERAAQAVERDWPWLDWRSYWGAADANSRVTRYDGALRRIAGRVFEKLHVDPNLRGIDGALIDLEYERIELIKFNLFDNYTFETYLSGKDVPGPAVNQWDEMHLPPDHPHYTDVVRSDDKQSCGGELIRFRTVSGICNDIMNPLMGSSNTLFARNVQFSETFPDEGHTDLTRARHEGRIDLMTPDPQVISRKLFTRKQSKPELCNQGWGSKDDFSAKAHCDYKPAPFFNVLAAFWIQFMTHDWFSHLVEGENDRSKPLKSAGCDLDEAQANSVGCRRGDQIEEPLVADSSPPPTFVSNSGTYLARAHKTFNNTVTAWWDASQIYGFDRVSRSRVKRDPEDRAKLLMRPLGGRSEAGEAQGYLPIFGPRCETVGAGMDCDQIHPAWESQETAAFADNWTIGMSFYHNIFSREHNAFVDEFRARTAKSPAADSGLRNPVEPSRPITYADVTDDELFEAARLVVSAEIAKVHTIEWTTQLLYDEPLYRGMNANWSGLFKEHKRLDKVVERLVVENFGESEDIKEHNQWYSVLAAGPGIVGLGSKRYKDKTRFERLTGKKKDIWTLHNNDHINGGTNHFGSPFNFPEEFTTVYRLHPLVPDLLELRDWDSPDEIKLKVPAVAGFRAGASKIVRAHGLADWALSMGRQRLGLLTLGNHGQFLQNLRLPRLKSKTGMVDIAALDLIRDRERGVPRFNEFRRQYGLKQLTGFDDFVDKTLPPDSPLRKEQEAMAKTLREVYGQHKCDIDLIISHAQRDERGNYPNDCLGHDNGTLVDNIEDLDTVVGWLAEPVRPHGFAISETQFVVFILNASRRLFSDRFFTSSFRPEFYTSLGHQWVIDNGPEMMMEKGKSNGHEQEVSPMKRILLRTLPELREELAPVVNVFDPWARDRGEYYSLQWIARKGAKADPAFADAQ